MDDGVVETIDLAWSDPALEVALWALVRGETQPALDLLAATQAELDRRELYVEVLGEAGQKRLADLRQLVNRDSDDVDRWLLYGSAIVNAAWTARGADVAERTTAAQFGGFIELTEQARAALRQAATLAPGDHVVWSSLMHCAHAIPAHDREQREFFAKATRDGQLLYGAHVSMLSSLTRKWYGSQQHVLEFARERTATLPDGHPLHALTAYAHIEGYLDGTMRGSRLARIWRLMRYFNHKVVRAEIAAGSDRLLASDAYAAHPRFIAAHQAYAMVFHHAEDERRSAPHLMRSGTRPAYWPWAYFGEPAEEFAKAKRAAGIRT
jgi:hypothetical protein